MRKPLWIGRAAALLFLIAAGCQGASAQSTVVRHRQIQESVQGRDYAGAVSGLEALRSADPLAFAANNYDYLLGRVAGRGGDLATAAAGYHSVVGRGSILSPYASWRLAQFARLTGNLVLEREHLRRLVATSSGSHLYDAAQLRLAESLVESGDDAGVISLLRSRTRTERGPFARRARAILAGAYLRTGQSELARQSFDLLISQSPDPARPDDLALAAARGLDEIDQTARQQNMAGVAELPESEHLRRASIYTFNREFDGAREHYLAVVEHNKQSPAAPDALYQIGRGFYQERRFDEALNYFQRIASDYPNAPAARDALNFTAAAYERSQRPDQAIAAYRLFMARYPGAPNPERPFLNIVDTLRDAGRNREALALIEQIRARFRGQIGETLALFSEARTHAAEGDWTAELASLDGLKGAANLGGTTVPGGTNQTEVTYLRAYALEQAGRTNEAIDAYLSIMDGRGEYYGQRATARLRALAADEHTKDGVTARLNTLRTGAREELANGRTENARRFAQMALRLTTDPAVTGELLGMLRRVYGELPGYNRLVEPALVPLGRQDLIAGDQERGITAPAARTLGDELAFLGLYDEAAPELFASRGAQLNAGGETEKDADQSRGTSGQSSSPGRAQAQPSSLDRAYTLAVYFKRGEMGDHAVRFAEPIWKNVPRDYVLAVAPRGMVELLYPAVYADALTEYASARGVDPRFVLSIARQESRFNPAAKSGAAARGMLQFIPSTASAVAAKIGRTRFDQDELYNPGTALLLGSAYMGDLFKQFPEMPQAVAASYNGGEDNVARWIARAASNDPDRYVPEVAFTQSKDYVYKVVTNFWTYQSLYTEQLRERPVPSDPAR